MINQYHNITWTTVIRYQTISNWHQSTIASWKITHCTPRLHTADMGPIGRPRGLPIPGAGHQLGGQEGTEPHGRLNLEVMGVVWSDTNSEEIWLKIDQNWSDDLCFMIIDDLYMDLYGVSLSLHGWLVQAEGEAEPSRHLNFWRVSCHRVPTWSGKPTFQTWLRPLGLWKITANWHEHR